MPSDLDLKGPDLRAALERVQQQVRADPSIAKHRIALFELFAVQGEWDRAMTQLNVLGELDASTLAMVQVYGSALRCEALRAAIFEGQKAPLLFGDPEQWMALLIEALRLGAQGRHAESQELRKTAFDAAPAIAGSVDGQAFEWIADGDIRLGPMLEAIIDGRYYWIPFQRIREIRIEKPTGLRDKVWMPAHFAWSNEGESFGLIPTRYPGSEINEEDGIRAGRRTEWVEKYPEVYHGLGQRMLATDAGEYPIMDIRKIELNSRV
jgi:type VI secretion system protein ImpE